MMSIGFRRFKGKDERPPAGFRLAIPGLCCVSCDRAALQFRSDEPILHSLRGVLQWLRFPS